MRSRLLPLFAFAAFTAVAHAQPWPQFRGPDARGSATGKDIPSAFSEKDGILWKLKIPGKGNSSPIVWDKFLFMETASDDGRERFLVCVDVSKPALAWKRSIPAEKAHTHVKNTMASSTPATDGERVYAAFWDGANQSLWCYTIKGEPVWNVPLGPFASEHGSGASPVLYKDFVYFADDMDKRSTLYCFDKKTGSPVWKKERPAFRACYSAPLIIGGVAGRPPELVVTSSMAITSYDPEKGDVLWNWKWDWSSVKKKDFPLRTIATPAFVSGVLCASSGDGGGDRLTSGIVLEGQGKETKTRIAWTNKKDFPYVPCVLEKGGYFYFVNDGGFAGCYDVKKGTRVWYERADDAKVAFTASPVMIDDRVFAASEAGDVYAFAADPKGFNRLGKSSLGEMIRATPAVADGRLYVRGAQHLYCIGKK